MTQTILGNILHPEYSYMAQRWRQWRLTYESGAFYIENYLTQFEYESTKSYNDRKQMTYVPAFAKEAVNEVRNAVWGRLHDVTRIGGDLSYQQACLGLEGGVDHRRSPMSDFIGRVVLPEMLTMRRVGVWIDMPAIKPNASKADVANAHPYLLWYPVESIRSWATDDNGRLTRILLKQSNFMHDEATGLPMSGDVESFRYAWLGDPEKGEDPRVHVREEDADGKQRVEEFILDLEEIPFTQFEIEHSIIEDVSQHQLALLNMESADVAWCVKANFPVWTEQFDPRAGSPAIRPAMERTKPPLPRQNTDNVSVPNTPVVQKIPAGQAQQAQDAKSEQRSVGPQTGVRYPLGLNQPGFVHPSSEPITASMAKEMQIKEDIRRLVHLSVAALDPRMASAESKEMDDRGLQSGLVAIGAALQRGEQHIAHHWAAYMGSQDARVRYPDEWTAQSEAGRRQDADQLGKLRAKVPSRTFQREVAKVMAAKLIGHKVGAETLDTIHAEIDAAEYMTADVDDLEKDIRSRLVSADTASMIRGYPKGEAEKALAEQAKQLSIIAISQSKGAGAAQADGERDADPSSQEGTPPSQARGLSAHPAQEESRNEKKLAAGKRGLPEDQTRGFGQDGGSDPLGSEPAEFLVDQD